MARVDIWETEKWQRVDNEHSPLTSKPPGSAGAAGRRSVHP
jgi:hypothetical protein